MLPVIAEVVRSGFVEGHHHGSVVALGTDGSAAYARGDVDSPVLPRSCNKPLQAVGMVRAGLALDDELLALAAASHSGEPFHVEAVERILASVGLGASALRNPVGWPLLDGIKDDLLRAGGEASVLTMNCSGKHAAMLATCVVNDWPLETYLDPQHPLQRALAGTFADLTGEPVAHTAVDGCGAPLLATSLTGLARAFGRLATSEEPALAKVARAMRRFPAYVSGTTRDELALVTAIPGAIAKAGAESCYVVALTDGRAFALKADDGGIRARPVVMAALLDQLGVSTEAGVDTEAVRRTGAAPLLGGDRVVGEVRAVL
ncbi:L-asparaginase II [Marmoricola sp. OAE513]|uniref:asparaginase n=1 Tax=Marmoricola sp. OAE513 TaxID=2817894 RepID=UPI001AEA3365